MSYLPPNHHLIIDYLSWGYGDDYMQANPFDFIGEVFIGKCYEEVRSYILELFPIGSRGKELGTTDLLDIRYSLTSLLISGWLLLQTDYYSDEWLDPNEMWFLRCPLPEPVEDWTPKSLQRMESKNLRKALSKLYFNINVRNEIYLLGDKIIDYSCEEQLIMTEEDLETRNRLLKILDVLTLITLDLKKKVTKENHIIYPPDCEGSN